MYSVDIVETTAQNLSAEFFSDTVQAKDFKLASLHDNNLYWSLSVHTSFDHLEPFSRSPGEFGIVLQFHFKCELIEHFTLLLYLFIILLLLIATVCKHLN